MGKAGLPDEVKAFIVGELACFATPSEVAALVKAEFDMDLTRQQIEAYDPTKAAGERLSDKWRALFEATRAECRQQVAEVPIASRVVRLKFLDRSFRKLERQKNILGAAAIIEQAAREVGGMYDRRPIGSGGAGRGAHARGAGDHSPEAILAADAKLRDFLKGGKVKAKR